MKKNKDALLLAEMAAWLHDMGKCSDEFLQNKNRRSWLSNDRNKPIDPYKAIIPKNKLTRYQFSNNFRPVREAESDYKFALNKIFDFYAQLVNNNIKIIDEYNNTISDVTIPELIYFGRPFFIGKLSRIFNNSWIIEYLGRCHGSAHIEKEPDSIEDQESEQTRLSTAFGYEGEKLTNLTKKLKALPFGKINNRGGFLKELKKAFKNAPGDTERPINEVTLWDWSSIVAALYKSALAGVLLGNKPEPNDLKWRLLAIRIDSERILGDASKIPVLLDRKKWISDGLDNVKKLLEEEYPLGNEVYRDENGSIFVVPDVKDLLKLREKNNSDKTLGDLISEKLGFEGEIVVTPSLSNHWWGQNTSGKPDSNKDKPPPIDKILEEDPYSPPDQAKVKEWWSGVTNTEICTISWVRRQGLDGSSRKASDYWAKRVRGRSEEWYRDRSKTIWIDEVADENGRICFITGKLDISGWLTPGGHVQTLLVKPPNGNGGQAVPKTPSFARLRRIWETTNTFWEDVQHDIESAVGNNNKRLLINGKITNKKGSLSENNVYEIEINGTRVSVFYTDSDQIIIVENLERLARKMGYSKNDDDYISYIQQELKDKEVRIFNPEGKNRDKHIGLLKSSKVEPMDDKFIPVIHILSEPSQFMAIVPANKAIEIVKGIKKNYETEMGKVRNRLPITIGLTFARSRTPLMALMDSGRKMINAPSKEEIKEEIWHLIDDAKQCNGDYVLNFQNEFTWRIPRSMGDFKTKDKWYPYFYVNGTLTDRKTAFQGPKGSLVHVSELKKGDAVKIMPSRFDFEFLDAASRRFEISYNENGKRRDKAKSNRPYLIGELDDFEWIWEIISKNLATTQIKNVIGLIEEKRTEWNSSSEDEVFQGFVHDILCNANWKNGIPPNINELVKMAVSGELRDIIEFYRDIMKVTEEKNMIDEVVIE